MCLFDGKALAPCSKCPLQERLEGLLLKEWLAAEEHNKTPNKHAPPAGSSSGLMAWHSHSRLHPRSVAAPLKSGHHCPYQKAVMDEGLLKCYTKMMQDTHIARRAQFSSTNA
eukprot:jgi/Botrbrau1/22241/Bobra.0138s0003.1